jgi:hypothetical protein
VLASVGTPTCDPVESLNKLVVGSAVSEVEYLALVPVSGDVVSTKINQEADSQQLIDNLFGMRLSISRPVNGLIKYFILFYGGL